MGMHDWQKYFRQAYEHLKPGAWFEVQELTASALTDDGSATKESKFTEWSDHMGEAAAKRGVNVHAKDNFTGWLREAGFETIREERMKWPIGPWTKDPFWKRFGYLNMENMLQGIEGMSMRLLTLVKGWTAEEIQVFLVGVRKDLKDPKTHYYMDMWVLFLSYLCIR